MLKKIEALREKPKHVRNAYAFWIALSITLCIASVWGLIKTTQLSGSEEVSEGKDAPSSLSRTFGDIKDHVRSVVANFRASTEYVKPEAPYVPKENTLNLDALFASSTKERQKIELQQPQSTTSRASSTRGNVLY